ncbi:hypothetical protein AcV7_004018 [Taiwanofungus camphoratus]|nr:hypothetical protein AcV7_004018 [Antrodia cinnamomea]
MPDEAPVSSKHFDVCRRLLYWFVHMTDGAHCHLLADMINRVFRVNIVSLPSIALDSTSLTDNANMVPYLPPEVTDYIINFLWYDFRTLYNCALVCHAWLPCSRFHLRSPLIIHNRSHFDDVVDDILHNQQLWPYFDLIQRLTVFEDRQKPYAHVVPHLFAPRMSKLTGLAFFYVDWCNQTRPHPSFFHLIALFTSVTYLHLYSCTFSTFGDSSEVTSYDDGARYPILARPRLLELNLEQDYARELTEWTYFLNASPSVRTIRTFSYKTSARRDNRCCLALNPLLESLGDVLHELVVPLNLAGDQCNLEHNHSLQSLTVKRTLVKLSEWPIYWDGVARLLSRVTSNHIRRLKFVILLQATGEFDDASDAPLSPEDTVDWEHVNDVTAHQCFDRLEKVHVYIETSSSINVSVAEVVAMRTMQTPSNEPCTASGGPWNNSGRRRHAIPLDIRGATDIPTLFSLSSSQPPTVDTPPPHTHTSNCTRQIALPITIAALFDAITTGTIVSGSGVAQLDVTENVLEPGYRLPNPSTPVLESSLEEDRVPILASDSVVAVWVIMC